VPTPKRALDPDDSRLHAIVRHMHLVGGLLMRDIVEELKAMGFVDLRGQAFPLSLVWTVLRASRRAMP
jgi:hypothetical protein